MIKKSFIAIVTVLLLVISVLAEMQFLKVAEANMIPIPTAEIYSPLPSTIYHNATVTLDVCLKNRIVSNPVAKITYSLDSGYNIEFANVTRSSEYQSFNYKVVDYRAITALENLKIGNHSVTVYVLSEYRSGGNPPTIDFVVANPDSSISPSPTPTIGLLTSTPTTNESGSNDSIISPTSALIIAVIVVSCACLVVGLLLKRKHQVKR